MASREQLIAQLSSDNREGVNLYHPARRAIVWGVLTWLLVLGATLWINDLRPGWAQQLIDNPRFGLETLSGLVAIVLTGVLAFRLGVPGSKHRWLIVSIVVTGGIWLGSIVYGFVSPSVAFSSEGARAFCRFETLIYALAPLLLGIYFLQRAYVLNWPVSATVVGMASALVPAWLMQLACVYHPQHILEAHLAPAVVVIAFAAAIGFLLKRIQQ